MFGSTVELGEMMSSVVIVWSNQIKMTPNLLLQESKSYSGISRWSSVIMWLKVEAPYNNIRASGDPSTV